MSKNRNHSVLKVLENFRNLHKQPTRQRRTDYKSFVEVDDERQKGVNKTMIQLITVN